MYELLVHDQVTEYEDRAEAVKAAKDLTGRPDGPLTSTVTDGIETLSFRDGKLVAYTYETRRTEQRRPRETTPPPAPVDDDAPTEETVVAATPEAPAPAASEVN